MSESFTLFSCVIISSNAVLEANKSSTFDIATFRLSAIHLGVDLDNGMLSSGSVISHSGLVLLLVSFAAKLKDLTRKHFHQGEDSWMQFCFGFHHLHSYPQPRSLFIFFYVWLVFESESWFEWLSPICSFQSSKFNSLGFLNLVQYVQKCVIVLLISNHQFSVR